MLRIHMMNGEVIESNTLTYARLKDFLKLGGAFGVENPAGCRVVVNSRHVTHVVEVLV